MSETDTPLRLADAARIAFPDGGMTAAGLRRERDRGRLEVWKVAGKEYVTLAAIQRMLDRCRQGPKESASTSGQPKAEAQPNGSSGMDARASAQAAASWLEQRLRECSRPTLKATTTRAGGNVVSMKSL